ncbi:N-acetyltransferase [Kangiella sp. HD9-110m-PIT-SAG07]|nr:N-acetyltransferase [Kangiella sp. HD9-110m-PIT-SAG07]
MFFTLSKPPASKSRASNPRAPKAKERTLKDIKSLVLKTAHSIKDVSAEEWEALLKYLPIKQQDHPFIQYEFLLALEETRSVSVDSGWQPCHLVFYQGDELVAALPNYLKGHSYGEYVFDWAWADAYERHGLEYYPKSLSAIPMTPITGPRLLSSLDATSTPSLVEAVIRWVEQSQMSSWHLNFVSGEASEQLISSQLLKREDIQFHWHNQGYQDFGEFLTSLKAKKRKNIVRERREFQEQGTEQEKSSGWSFEWLDGHTASEEDWQLFDRMYRNTFDKKGGWAQLSHDFFGACAKAMPDQTLLLLAKHEAKPIAGAFFMRSESALYGRYWGCFEDVDFLHFETCYYQGIEYAIEHGLSLFEPGAQGEHKLARGFMPVSTHSLHYVSRPEFREAISHAITQEEEWLDIRYQDYLKHSPYK